MHISKMNKYLLSNLFSFIDFKKKLNIIKYNKILMKQLDITTYTYQITYFDSIVNPAILKDSSILLKNNIFDKKALDKLMSDWKNKTTGIFEGNDFFTKITDLAIFENFKEIKKKSKNQIALFN